MIPSGRYSKRVNHVIISLCLFTGAESGKVFNLKTLPAVQRGSLSSLGYAESV